MNNLQSLLCKASLADLKKLQSSISTKINELSNAKTKFNHEDYVNHQQYLITDQIVLSNAIQEVDSLPFNHDKLDTVWINQVNEQYIFNG